MEDLLSRVPVPHRPGVRKYVALMVQAGALHQTSTRLIGRHVELIMVPLSLLLVSLSRCFSASPNTRVLVLHPDERVPPTAYVEHAVSVTTATRFTLVVYEWDGHSLICRLKLSTADKSSLTSLNRALDLVVPVGDLEQLPMCSVSLRAGLSTRTKVRTGTFYTTTALFLLVDEICRATHSLGENHQSAFVAGRAHRILLHLALGGVSPEASRHSELDQSLHRLGTTVAAGHGDNASEMITPGEHSWERQRKKELQRAAFRRKRSERVQFLLHTVDTPWGLLHYATRRPA